MPQDATFKETIPQVLINLFKEKMGKSPFKQYFEGDPIIIGKSLMPCLIVSEPVTSYGRGPTGFEEIEHEVLIQVVFNKKDEFGKPANEATLERTIDRITQGRDELTGDFKDNSVIGVLLRNITLGNLSLNTIPRVEKGVLPRGEDLLTVEGHVRVVITELQEVRNRV